jgi:ketosteroid isomerase-like protein
MHMAPDDDVRAIEALITRQFARLTWREGAGGDWNAFSADFLADAQLFPAARPARPQSVNAFVERMQGLAATKLRSLHQRLAGREIRVFGNIAVAAAVNEMTENDAGKTRAVEMLLLVKDNGAWRIAAQAWDSEALSKPIAPELSAR